MEQNEKNSQMPDTIISQEKPIEYCVFEHPLLPMRIVKQGFCWPALIVGPAYLLYRKLWVPLVVWFALLGVARYFAISQYPNYLLHGSDADTVEIIYVGALFLGLLILGIDANSLWQNDLLNRGYVKTKILFARSKDGALASIAREKATALVANRRSTDPTVSDPIHRRTAIVEDMSRGWRLSVFSMFALLAFSIFIVVVVSSVRSEDSTKADQERQAHEAIVAQGAKNMEDARKRALPNPTITPGAIDPGITQDNIQKTLCAKGYIKAARPPAKLQQIQAYGEVIDSNNILYEEDHLIALSIGGSPHDPRNLWPLARDATKKNLWEPQIFWTAEKKDELELALFKMVCAQEISLAEAQHAIASNWEDAWDKYYSAPLRGIPAKKAL